MTVPFNKVSLLLFHPKYVHSLHFFAIWKGRSRMKLVYHTLVKFRFCQHYLILIFQFNELSLLQHLMMSKVFNYLLGCIYRFYFKQLYVALVLHAYETLLVRKKFYVCLHSNFSKVTKTHSLMDEKSQYFEVHLKTVRDQSSHLLYSWLED